MHSQAARQKQVHLFDNIKLDLQRELPQLLYDIYEMSKRNSCLVDVELNAISLYQEQGSRLKVIKIAIGRNKHVERVTKMVFEKPRVEPVERYIMIGIDGTTPIWKPDDIKS
ncbi:MAG: hypothetical protein KGI33_04145 [Thaumarchaeota archaeon]|nr:hypothetical protein [Nitrososphaerota archaeon]